MRRVAPPLRVEPQFLNKAVYRPHHVTIPPREEAPTHNKGKPKGRGKGKLSARQYWNQHPVPRGERRSAEAKKKRIDRGALKRAQQEQKDKEEQEAQRPRPSSSVARPRPSSSVARARPSSSVAPLRLQSVRRSPTPSPLPVRKVRAKPVLVPIEPRSKLKSRPRAELLPKAKGLAGKRSRSHISEDPLRLDEEESPSSAQEGTFEEATPPTLSERERFLANRARLKEVHKKRKWARGTVQIVQRRERERSCSSCVLRNKRSIKAALAWFKNRKAKGKKEAEEQRSQRAEPRQASSSSTNPNPPRSETPIRYRAGLESKFAHLRRPSTSPEAERVAPRVRRVSISPTPSVSRGLSQLPKRRRNDGKRHKR